MDIAKINVYKKILQEVCKNFIGAEEFIRDKIEEICCNEKLLSVEEVNLFCLWKIATAFKAKLVMFAKIFLKKIASIARFIGRSFQKMKKTKL